MSSPVRRFSFIITDGYIDKSAPDFLHFRQHYSLCWGMLEDALSCLERLLREYAIPVALLDGDWLVSLAYSGELEWGRPMDQLLSALDNWEEVLNLMRQPGQRYKGERGREAAAIRIQAYWRRHCVRAAYLLYRRRRRAAGIIAISWLMHVRLSQVKRALRASRQRHLENFRRRSKYLTDNWEQIMSSRRTVIHIPSLGYSETQRFSMTNLTVQQNVQMGRLCDTYDRNVEVIYVSPVRIGDDLSQYYSRLLELQQDVSLGGPETCQGPCAKRFTILTPEALEYFPTHNMCLSTLVKYSPHTLHRIKKLIQGKQAYMVSGVTHMDDLAVADELGVPLLGTEPALAQLYGTKSGGRRIFSSAGLMVPPGHCNIYTAEQLHESLAQLITDNMEVQRWLFKMDNEFGGRGTAYFDVVHLKCYTWAQYEYQQYGPDRWPRTWAQELVLTKVLEEVPELLSDYARPVNTTLYSTWDQFLQVFLRQGGTLEAYPPSDSVACLSADLLVEPGGKVSMLSCGDHLHGPSLLETAGSFVPQTSICPDLLSSICARVGRACQESHIIGHVSLDLVAFMKPNSQEQQVWATDLDLCYSDQLAMTKLLLMMTRGHLDCHTGCLEVPLSFKEDKLSQDHKEAKPAPMTRRYAVMSSQLQHTNLSMVHYGVFFQMCKAQGIGFDIKEKQGTLFVLHDSTERNSLGMLTVAESLQGALISFARNMSVVHQEISAPNMQGETNFKDFIRRIERVLEKAVKTVKADKVRNKTKA